MEKTTPPIAIAPTALPSGRQGHAWSWVRTIRSGSATDTYACARCGASLQLPTSVPVALAPWTPCVARASAHAAE